VYERDNTVAIFDGLLINEKVVDEERRNGFALGQCDLYFAAMAVKCKWPRITPNFHVVLRLGNKKIPHYLCTVLLFGGRFSHGLVNVKRPPDCVQLPVAIEFDRHFCVARPETVLHDTPTDQTHAHCFGSVYIW